MVVYYKFQIQSLDLKSFDNTVRHRKKSGRTHHAIGELKMKKLTQATSRANPSAITGADFRRQLKAELTTAGCFTPAPLRQSVHMIIIVLVYGAGYALLLTGPDIVARVALVLLLAFISVQAGYIAHEAGHGAITRKRWLAVAIGQFFNTLLTALCYSHFQKIHVCHHRHCNDQDRDIDMQSAFFSFYPEARQKNTSPLGRFVTRHQAWLIWLLVSFQGLSLKIDSLKTLYRDPRGTRIDQILLLLHLLLWFGPTVYLLGFGDALLNYLLLTWFIGPYLGSVFLVNHIGTHEVRAGDGVCGFMQQLMTTRNLGDSRPADVFFGGLNNHIEHHLFPSIPSARLRQARPIVEAFCARHGLDYRKTTWRHAVRDVSTYLRQIARQPLAPLNGFDSEPGWQR
jgi:fatty acid desaturase